MGTRGGKISPATEFKPGKSGNPNGRPKKLPGLDKLLADILGAEDDDKSAAFAVLDAMLKKAKKGDVNAAKLLLERAYGKPKENQGQPTEMIIHVKRRS